MLEIPSAHWINVNLPASCPPLAALPVSFSPPSSYISCHLLSEVFSVNIYLWTSFVLVFFGGFFLVVISVHYPLSLFLHLKCKVFLLHYLKSSSECFYCNSSLSFLFSPFLPFLFVHLFLLSDSLWRFMGWGETHKRFLITSSCLDFLPTFSCLFSFRSLTS